MGILEIFAIFLLGIWDIFQNNYRDMRYWDPHPSRASIVGTHRNNSIFSLGTVKVR